MTNLKSQQNRVNQIINPHAFLFFLLTGAKVFYNLHVQGSTYGGKFDKFGGNPLKKLNSAEFMGFVFSKSEVPGTD